MPHRNAAGRLGHGRRRSRRLRARNTKHRKRLRRHSPDNRKIAAAIEKALRDVDGDVQGAAKRWRKDIDRELGREVDVKVDADVRAAEKKLDKLEKDRHIVDLDADTAKAQAEIERLEHERRTVHIGVDVDRDRLEQTTSAIGTHFASTAAATGVGFGTAFATGAASSLGSANLGAVGMAALVPLATAATGIAAATGALGLIPAAVTGAASGIGTLALAFQGFGDALSSMGDPEKFATALQALLPAAPAARRRRVAERRVHDAGHAVRQRRPPHPQPTRAAVGGGAATAGQPMRRLPYGVMVTQAVRLWRWLVDGFKEAFEPALSGAWDGGVGTQERQLLRVRACDRFLDRRGSFTHDNALAL